MPMSTEQIMSYLSKDEDVNNEVTETPNSTEESSTEVKEEVSKSEESNDNSPDNVTKVEETTNNVGESETKETKGSDEPKVNEVEDVKNTNEVKQSEDTNKDNHTKKEQRDYALLRWKQRAKEAEAKYKEIQEAWDKYKNLEFKDFKDKEGNPDYGAYTNWKLQERDMQYEMDRLKQEQLNYQLEQDRIVTERCFQGQELDDYNNLVISKGQAFAKALSKYDKKGSVLSYIDTVADYPIVVRELMTKPNDWLPKIFRTNKYSSAVETDSDKLKSNTAKVVEEILDDYYSKKSQVNVQPKEEIKASESVPRQPIPIIGKQTTNSGAGSEEESSFLTSMAAMNKYLSKHKRR